MVKTYKKKELQKDKEKELKFKSDEEVICKDGARRHSKHSKKDVS